METQLDFAGFQVGADIAKLNVNGWNLTYGATAGYLAAKAKDKSCGHTAHNSRGYHCGSGNVQQLSGEFRLPAFMAPRRSVGCSSTGKSAPTIIKCH